jgi:hypothetical protein
MMELGADDGRSSREHATIGSSMNAARQENRSRSDAMTSYLLMM